MRKRTYRPRHERLQIYIAQAHYEKRALLSTAKLIASCAMCPIRKLPCLLEAPSALPSAEQIFLACGTLIEARFLDLEREKYAMRTFIIGLLGLALSSVAAEAKGCIKGAIVGGVGGSIMDHGKVGAVAGCIVGRLEANKANANKAITTGQSPKN